jgi:hypothetical protein
MSKSILQIENVLFNKISFCNEYNLDDKYVVIGLGYGNSDPLMINIRSLDVQLYNSTTNEIYLDLRKNPEIKNFFETLDNTLTAKIKSDGVLKKIGIRGVSYKSLVNDFTNTDDETFDVLRLKLMFNCDYKTILYDSDRNIVDESNVITHIQKGSKAKVILELVAIVVDKETKTIFVYNVVRHIQTKKNKPTRVKNIEFSFVDSEDENTVVLSEVQNSHQNVETESYIDTEIVNFSKKDKQNVKRVVFVSKEETNKEESAKGESAKGESAKGESAKGESAKGESAKGWSDEEVNSKGESDKEDSSTEESDEENSFNTESDSESNSDVQNSIELSSDTDDSDKFVKQMAKRNSNSMQLSIKAPKSLTKKISKKR